MDFKEIVGWTISISGALIILMVMVVTCLSLADDLKRILKKDARDRRDDGPR